MTTVTVNSTSALKSALASAQAGETIQLAAGTYTGVTIAKANLNGVTITSADPSHRAVITGMTVSNSSGITFSNLDFSFAKATSQAGINAFGVQLTGSQNVTFDHDGFHGPLDNDPTLDIRGLNLAQDTNVKVTNSEFQDLYVGIHNLNTTGVTITGDNFHDIRSDGIDNSGVSNLNITDDTFSNFWRVGEPASGGDHGDAVQFFTQAGQSVNQNINVSNNVFVQGQGLNFQDIFVQDMTAGAVPYKNVTINGNLIVGGSYNAIWVGGPPSGTTAPAASGVTITNNTMVQTAGQAQDPGLIIQNVNGATVTNNAVPRFNTKADTNLVQSGNSTSASVADNGVSLLNAWLQQHSHPMSVGFTSATQIVNNSISGVPTGGAGHAPISTVTSTPVTSLPTMPVNSPTTTSLTTSPPVSTPTSSTLSIPGLSSTDALALLGLHSSSLIHSAFGG